VFPTSKRATAAQQAAEFVARLTLGVHVVAVVHEHQEGAGHCKWVVLNTRWLVRARAAC
jgi:hypothetical protein